MAKYNPNYKIYLDTVETDSRVKALGLKSHYQAAHCRELYYNPEIDKVIVVLNPDTGRKQSGVMMIPMHVISAMHVAERSIPEHQPVGTTPEYDTASGRRYNKTSSAKTVIQERAEVRHEKRAAIDKERKEAAAAKKEG